MAIFISQLVTPIKSIPRGIYFFWNKKQFQRTLKGLAAALILFQASIWNLGCNEWLNSRIEEKQQVLNEALGSSVLVTRTKTLWNLYISRERAIHIFLHGTGTNTLEKPAKCYLTNN